VETLISSEEFRNIVDRVMAMQKPENFLEMLRRMKLLNEKHPKNLIAVLTSLELMKAEAETKRRVLAV